MRGNADSFPLAPPPLRIPFLITDQRCWCTKCINCDDCECGAYHTPSAKKSSGGKRAPSGVNTGGVSTHHQHKGEQQVKRGKSPVKARQQHESEQPTTAHATPSPEQGMHTKSIHIGLTSFHKPLIKQSTCKTGFSH